MKDIKYILVILGFDLCYSYIFKGKFEVNDIISILLILTFSIYICGTIITYKFNLTYTDNLHKNLTLAFLAIGIVAFSYFYVLRIGDSVKLFTLRFLIFLYISRVPTVFLYKKTMTPLISCYNWVPQNKNNYERLSLLWNQL